MFPELSTIKHKRKVLNITQKDLANATKISQSLIAKIESNKIIPSYTIASKIFKFLENQNNKKERSCKEIMSTKIIFLKPRDLVSKAVSIMKREGISQIPIINNKQNIGTISEEVLYKKMEEGITREKLIEMEIKEVMEEPLPTADEQTPIINVLPLLKYTKAILIRNKKGFSGILTITDIL